MIGYNDYKPIRNNIRKFNVDVLILTTIDSLYNAWSMDSYDWPKKGLSPWELMLLLKWLYWEKKLNQYKNEVPKYKDFANIVNKVKDFPDNSLENFSNHKLYKFMRKTAFQQFWLQTDQMPRDSFGRVIQLFFKLPIKFDLDKFLLEKIGLTREELFDLYFIAWIKYNSLRLSNPNERFLETSFYSTVKTLSKEKVELFFELISLPEKDFMDYCETCSNKNFYHQRDEQTPFKKFPFLKTQKGLLCFYPTLITENLEYFLYDYCKEHSNGAFGTAFGDVFEVYVKNNLSLLGMPVLNEKEICSRFGSKKSVDCFIASDKGNLLIECKATEMSYLGKVDPSDENLEKYLKHSVVKGTAQIIETINFAKKTGNLNNQDYFAWIVTYKELYLGNFEDAWEEFLKNKIQTDYGSLDLASFDVQKVFFINISDFDKAIAVYQGNYEALINTLNEIVEIKKDINKKKFIFGKYLEGIKKESPIKLLEDNFEEYFNKMTRLLSH